MARSTRLYQRAQSPLIQGLSKRQRPWWQPAVGAFCSSLLAVFAIWWLLAVAQGTSPLGALVIFVVEPPFVLFRILPGALIGAVGGVLGARAWGSSHPWIVGAVLGSVFGGATLAYIMLIGGQA
ncbi:MAG: hypothetical protein Q8S43_10795 [Actinomycetota bacterium]|nr:MAG: hypothetical protein FD171_1714 [Actinomycetota bacterium]MDO8950464.1 hypothetical protein [Actinomycetota bacterium]MDP3631420.1 hypothetical protein [Actinomycetota bacterium]